MATGGPLLPFTAPSDSLPAEFLEPIRPQRLRRHQVRLDPASLVDVLRAGLLSTFRAQIRPHSRIVPPALIPFVDALLFENCDLSVFDTTTPSLLTLSLDLLLFLCDYSRQKSVILNAKGASMIALYDRRGKVSAFLAANGRIVSRTGESVAWIQNGSVYDYHGQHLGWWENNHMRGSDGGIVVWLQGATGLGVVSPVPSVPPVPPVPSVEPVRPVPSAAPVRPVNKLSWSYNTTLNL
jgi:4-fold beta-flower domain-containing protein